MRRFRLLLTSLLIASLAGAVPALADDATGDRPIARAVRVHAARLASGPRQQPAPPGNAPSASSTGGSIATGAVIGFGVGAVLGSTIGQEACLHSPGWHCAVNAGALFAIIGGTIGWLIR